MQLMNGRFQHPGLRCLAGLNPIELGEEWRKLESFSGEGRVGFRPWACDARNNG